MILTQEQFVDRIAARTVDSRTLLAQDLKQRRNQVVDLQGVEYERNVTIDTNDPNAGDSSPVAYIALSISPDLIYWERFEFKVTVYNAFSGVKNARISIDGVDVSAYFAAQYDAWIDSTGIFPSGKVSQNYDVLQAASAMYAEHNDAMAEAILKPGYKLIAISADTSFRIMLTLYTKYSHCNR